jgi:hypothetical protein
MVIFGKTWDKQLLDQSLHCLAGIGLTVLLNIAVAAIYAVPYVAAFGVGREMIQHRSFRIGPGSLFDASFFLVGSLIWVAVLYFK